MDIQYIFLIVLFMLLLFINNKTNKNNQVECFNINNAAAESESESESESAHSEHMQPILKNGNGNGNKNKITKSKTISQKVSHWWEFVNPDNNYITEDHAYEISMTTTKSTHDMRVLLLQGFETVNDMEDRIITLDNQINELPESLLSNEMFKLQKKLYTMLNKTKTSLLIMELQMNLHEKALESISLPDVLAGSSPKKVGVKKRAKKRETQQIEAYNETQFQKQTDQINKYKELQEKLEKILIEKKYILQFAKFDIIDNPDFLAIDLEITRLKRGLIDVKRVIQLENMPKTIKKLRKLERVWTVYYLNDEIAFVESKIRQNAAEINRTKIELTMIHTSQLKLKKSNDDNLGYESRELMKEKLANHILLLGMRNKWVDMENEILTVRRDILSLRRNKIRGDHVDMQISKINRDVANEYVKVRDNADKTISDLFDKIGYFAPFIKESAVQLEVRITNAGIMYGNIGNINTGGLSKDTTDYEGRSQF